MAERADALFLGLDVGTQGTKGVLLGTDPGHPPVAEARAQHTMVAELGPGAMEQDPEDWLRAVASVVRELLEKTPEARERLQGVGVSGQQHGLVVLDETQNPLRPAKLWCDTATAVEADEISRALNRRVPTGFTAPKVLWMQRREPELWARVAHVLLPHDFINLWLCGRVGSECGDTSGTGWFDVARREHDPAVLEVLGGEDFAWRLAPLHPSDRPLARTQGPFCEQIGLPEGLVLATGSGDNMMSALGAGAVTPGRMVVSLGTSATAFARTDQPVIDPRGEIAGFCDATGGWLPLLCTMNATGVSEEVRALCGATDEAGLSRLTEAAAAEPAGSEGLVFLPYLVGERVPDLPSATGALLGLRPGALRPGRLFRAALEGATLGIVAGLRRMERLGLQPRELALVGGGAKNPLWAQILASASGHSVARLEVSETAAMGAALQAMWVSPYGAGRSASDVVAPFAPTAARRFEPDPREHSLYAERLEVFEEHTERLFGAAPGENA